MENTSLVPEAGNEITVIEDDKGLAVFGDSGALDAWLSDNGLGEHASPMRVSKAAADASKGVAAVGQLMEQSGRWVKLDAKSAKLAKQYGLKSGVIRGNKGQIIKHVQFAKAGALTTPAGAAVLASVIAQQAIEQAIDEVVDYLEKIDQKVNRLIQDQKDQAVASLFSHRQVVAEAFAIREQTGKVSETTWSKVANLGQDTTRMQKYALTKIQGLAQSLQEAKSANDLKDAAEQAQADIPGWLMVLGNSIVIQDQLAILELDRVVLEDAEMLEAHRKGIELARQRRMGELETALVQLGNQLKPAWDRAERLQIRHPNSVKKAFNGLAGTDEELDGFARAIEITENSWNPVDTKKWHVAVGDHAKSVGKKVANSLPNVEINVNFNKGQKSAGKGDND